MNQTTLTPVVENIEMNERYIEVYFRCTLAGVPVYVTGNYCVNLNAFNVRDINEQTVEELCEEMGWNSYETEQAIQKAFENR